MRAYQIHPPEEDDTPSLLIALGLTEDPSGRQPGWLIRAVAGVAAMWPLVLIARAATIAAILIPWAIGGGPIAGGTAGFAVAVDLLLLALPRVGPFTRLPPHRQLRLLMPLLFTSGLLYAWMVTAALSFAGMEFGLTGALAILLPAMVAVSIAGGQRILGFCYCLGSLLPCFLLLSGLHTAVPCILCLIGLALASIGQARTDQRHHIGRQANMMRGEQARALLTEFEEAHRGWFWETDRAGRLTYISATLAARFGRTAEDLLGLPFTELMQQDATATASSDGQRTVGFHLSARSAFSDITVRSALDGGEHWWALSGRPVVNPYGQFLGFRGSGADLTEMRKSQAEVAKLARFDSLTGLANRSQTLATLEQSIVDLSGRPAEVALFMLDLDRFKVVNDTMGHPAGDALLRQVAARLTRVVGESGKVGRLGGDEFQIVLPGQADRAVLARLAEAIIHNVSQPYVIEGTQVVIGVSIGIALAPDDGVTADTLIRNADLALYKSKDNGRGAFFFYSQDLHADAEDRRQLEQDLRQAINSGGLHVEYQPVVSAVTERITGFETLVRWTHPVRGPVSPALFIPIAEEAGLIAQIGEWVLRTACDDAVHWPDDIRVAVNVSPIQFRNPGFPALVVNALAKSGLVAERLELEITESVFLEGGDTDAMFARLKGIGVRLALDDFGTGYSALGYLKTAPFDKIKIDQSFVRGAAIKGSRNGAIVQSIVSLAEALGMETTAEGAETLDELELIRALGCSHIQGYIYGRPQPNAHLMAHFAGGDVHVRPSGHKTSRENRKTILRSVRLVHGTHSYEARMRNISSLGAMIEGLAGVPAGTVFTLYFSANHFVQATCRWSTEDRMGLEFAQPVRLDQARALEERFAGRTEGADSAPMRRAG